MLEVANIRFADEDEEKEVKDDMPRDNPLSDRIAFDAQSSRRHKDDNGYLHVDASNITKEQVAPYYGEEIPHWRELGLEPSKLYYMYRPADERAKAADGFNGMPLLFEHHDTSAARPEGSRGRAASIKAAESAGMTKRGEFAARRYGGVMLNHLYAAQCAARTWILRRLSRKPLSILCF